MNIDAQGRYAIMTSLLLGGGVHHEVDDAGRTIAIRPARDLFTQTQERILSGMKARVLGDVFHGPGNWRPVRDEDGIVVDVEPLRPPEPIRGLFADRVIVDEYETPWGPEPDHAEVRRVAAKHLPDPHRLTRDQVAALFDVPRRLLGGPDLYVPLPATTPGVMPDRFTVARTPPPPPDGAEVMRNVRRALTAHRRRDADDPGALLVAGDVWQALEATVAAQPSWPAPGARSSLWGVLVEREDGLPPGVTYLEPREQTQARHYRQARRAARVAALAAAPVVRTTHRGDLMAELTLPLPTTDADVVDCLEAVARQVGRVDDLRLAPDVYAAVLAVKVADGHDPDEGVHFLQGVPVQEDALLPAGTWAADENPLDAAQRAAAAPTYPEPPHVVNAREEGAADPQATTSALPA